MKHKIDSKTLTLYLEGEVNSGNAEGIEQEIDSLLEGLTLEKVIVDLGDLHYMSSAGLRIIVRLKQRYDDVSLIRVPNDVYEVLAMVGFPQLMPISKLGE